MLEIEPLRIGSKLHHPATGITWEVVKIYDDGDVTLISNLGTYTKANKKQIDKHYTKISETERKVHHGVV